MSSPMRLGSSHLPSFQSFFNNFFDNDDLFGHSLLNRDLTPAVNVKETKDSYLLEIAAPGFGKDEIDVSVTEDELVISAEKKEEASKEEENFMRREWNYSSFRRMFALPDNVQASDLKASYRDGVLELRLPKSKKSRSAEARKIEIG